MKPLSTGLFALGLLAAPFAAFGDVQITSFDTEFAPWVEGVGTNSVGVENTYQITTASQTHGTASAEIILPLVTSLDGEGNPTSGGIWQTVINVTTDNYASVVAQATGIRADVYFDWADRPANTVGGTWGDLALEIDSQQNGYARIGATSGSLAQGEWRTLFFPLTADQVSKLTALNPGVDGGDPTPQTFSRFGFHIGMGTWGGAPFGGTITLRIDNVVVVGASLAGPAAPTDLAGTPTLGGANLTWTASPNALTYTVKRRASATDAYVTIASDLAATSYNDTGLEGNTTYQYVVTATNADGESGFSASVSVTTLNDEVLLTSFESGLAPWTQGSNTTEGGGAIAYSITTTSATEGSASAEASLNVLAGQFKSLFSVPVADYRTTIAQSTGIKADVYVEWIDRPINTYAGVNLEMNYPGTYGTLGSSQSQALTGGWQTLTWNLTAEQIAALTSNGNSFSTIGFLINAGTWDSAVTLGGTLVVRIDNIRVKGFRSVAVPAAPTGLVATAGPGQVGLAWNASATANGYTVQRSLVAGGPYATVANLGNVTTHTDTGLSGETTYYYVVLPVNAGGDGPASAEASATTEAVALSGIESWRQTHFGAPEATGDAANDADPDADGVANLLEYALAGDPMMAEQDLLPVQGVAGGKLTLSFDRISDPALTYEVLASDDLATWSPIWSSTGDDNVAEFVTVTDPELLSDHTRRFLRLRVTAP